MALHTDNMVVHQNNMALLPNKMVLNPNMALHHNNMALHLELKAVIVLTEITQNYGNYRYRYCYYVK